VIYISGGLGNTKFAGDDRYTIAGAVGYRTLFTDYFSLDIEMRDLIFNMDIFGQDETTNNLELTIGLNLYF
jgi:outer membrane beta-barrel protein